MSAAMGAGERRCVWMAGVVRTDALQGGLLVRTWALLPRVLGQDGERRVTATASFRRP